MELWKIIQYKNWTTKLCRLIIYYIIIIFIIIIIIIIFNYTSFWILLDHSFAVTTFSKDWLLRLQTHMYKHSPKDTRPNKKYQITWKTMFNFQQSPFNSIHFFQQYSIVVETLFIATTVELLKINCRLHLFVVGKFFTTESFFQVG